ncbi:hypothetical protein [Paenibacillus odorifer]|uniref:hypothetical protein n=1 Tax=Paenibacillus odorifer TaxID=189426 RepID=UPI00096F24AA|nr:hypothetical protein [Paenibacillus odorifer]OME27751.1 hypothetical protein BSK57_03815 [Paenibacillus odorifer]
MVIVILIVSAALIGVVLKVCEADDPSTNLDNKQQLLHWLQINKSLDMEEFSYMQHMDYLTLQSHLVEQNIISQNELVNLTNPYINPGNDLVIDHDYHGMKNGSSVDDQMDFFSSNSNNNLFGGGFGGDSNNSGNNF